MVVAVVGVGVGVPPEPPISQAETKTARSRMLKLSKKTYKRVVFDAVPLTLILHRQLQIFSFDYTKPIADAIIT